MNGPFCAYGTFWPGDLPERRRLQHCGWTSDKVFLVSTPSDKSAPGTGTVLECQDPLETVLVSRRAETRQPYRLVFAVSFPGVETRHCHKDRLFRKINQQHRYVSAALDRQRDASALDSA